MSGHDDPRRNETGSVLIVDDHRNARESMAEVLRMAGHAATPCSSAAEAIRVLSRESFDCVVTDLKMPGMSGLEFIAEIDPPRTGAQVVMVTAHASVATAVEAMRSARSITSRSRSTRISWNGSSARPCATGGSCGARHSRATPLKTTQPKTARRP